LKEIVMKEKAKAKMRAEPMQATVKRTPLKVRMRMRMRMKMIVPIQNQTMNFEERSNRHFSRMVWI
jgi:hypothetical protein